MRGDELLEWLSKIEPRARDAAIERALGIDTAAVSSAPPRAEMVGHHASGVAAIVRALVEAPVTEDDVVVDVGAGLGKVVLLAHLLTGAEARGIELQRALVVRARESVARALATAGLAAAMARANGSTAATRPRAGVRFDCADARDGDLGDGTVFFLYAPFTGLVLARVLERLADVAARRAIVVCALGIELHRDAPWLVARPNDSFWLSIYDSVMPGVPRRSRRTSALDAKLADVVANERPSPA